MKNKDLHARASKKLKDRLKAIADRLEALGYDTSESNIVRTGTEKEVKHLEKTIKRS